jgi:transcriptional regulator with XRE-family HTH domain
MTLGSYLKAARKNKDLSAVEVAGLVGLGSPTDVLSWERDEGQALPLPLLERLIKLYGLDVPLVFDLLLSYQLSRIDRKLSALRDGAR